LNDLLSNKGKLLENIIISLIEERTAIIQNKFSPKISDTDSFSIPSSIGDVAISRALCDLGASVSLMPYSTCKKLQMDELKPNTISLQVPHRFVKYSLSILEDVPLEVRKFFIYCDFVVMAMKGDTCIPIILEGLFFAPTRAIIDLKIASFPFR